MNATLLGFHLVQLAEDQAEWADAVFGGPDVKGPVGPLKHLAKEVNELLADPTDLKEYADVLILLLDSSRRAGYSFVQVVEAARAKMQENRTRKWPAFDPAKVNEPVEHIRGNCEETHS